MQGIIIPFSSVSSCENAEASVEALAETSVRWRVASRAAVIAVFAGVLMAPSPTFAQFRDVTSVQNPEVTPTNDAPRTSPPEPADDADDAEDVAAQQGSDQDPQEVTQEVEVPSSLSVDDSRPEIDKQKQKFTIDELEQMLEDDGHEPGEKDTGTRELRFRGIMVGESSLEELLEKWGKPYKLVKSPASRIIKYRVEPFRQIDVTTINDKVVSILIYLNDLLEPSHVSEQLGLSHLEPVPIPDERGKIMGLTFPERGVLYSFDTRYPELLVSKIQLERVNPEPFVMRAEYDFDRRFEKNIADLDRALEMSPKYARAHWIRAEKLSQVGRNQDALESADKAVHYEPENDLYRMTKARIMAANGNHDAAVRDVDRLLLNNDLRPEIRAMAEWLNGDLIAEEAGALYKEAMEHHLKAVELAASLANHRVFAIRRYAKDVLIRAHLSIARDISLGDFKNQPEVVRKWIERSFALVDESITRDQGDPARLLDVYYQTLATAADIRAEEDPAPLVKELREEATIQMENDPDEKTMARLEWKLGAALAEAVRLERIHGNERQALELADEALVLLQRSARVRQSSPAQKYLVGRLYFHVGSLHAVQREDHEEAIAWYRKAEPLLAGEVPPGVLADPGTHGEMFVSMGVSYWESGNRPRAIELTEMGTDVLQRAVVDGSIESVSLSIPYGNLSTMHEKAGNDEDAKAFAELAAAISSERR